MKYVKMELHTHTVHSDGRMQPEQLVEKSVLRRYDAIVSTDHNTISAIPYLKKAAENTSLTVLDGIEWTTFWGHLVVSGGKSKIDWRSVNLQNIDQKIALAASEGDVVTLAHPTRIGGRICCGCHNDYDIKHWENVGAIEVWSRHFPNINLANMAAKKLWIDLLMKGYKIAAVYGYDWHTTDDICPPYGATYVGIDGEITNQSFVDAIKHRRSYISEGVTIDVKLTQNGKSFEIGDDLTAGEATIDVVAKEDEYFCSKYKTRIDGVRLSGTAVSAEEKTNGLHKMLTLKKGFFYIEVFGEVEGGKGELVLTSPYFVE